VRALANAGKLWSEAIRVVSLAVERVVLRDRADR
jgi:hypothetical protein